AIAKQLKKYVDEEGFTMVKGVMSIETVQMLHPDEEIISAPGNDVEEYTNAGRYHFDVIKNHRGAPDFEQRNRAFDLIRRQPFNGMYRITEHGLDRYEEQIANMREVLGYK